MRWHLHRAAVVLVLFIAGGGAMVGQDCAPAAPLVKDDPVDWPSTRVEIPVLANDGGVDLKIDEFLIPPAGANGTVTLSADRKKLYFTPAVNATSGEFLYTAREAADSTKFGTARVSLVPAGSVDESVQAFTWQCTRWTCFFLVLPERTAGVQKYRWTFGDQSPEVDDYTLPAINHTFPESETAQSYTVRLTATYYTGLVIDSKATVLVEPPRYFIDWEPLPWPDSYGTRVNIRIGAASLDGCGATWAYEVFWGDGTSTPLASTTCQGITSRSAAHVYDSGGQKTLFIRASRLNGSTNPPTVDHVWNSPSYTIAVQPEPPIPRIRVQYDPDDPKLVTLHPTWRENPNDPQWPITTTVDEWEHPLARAPRQYVWELDDGTVIPGTLYPANHPQFSGLPAAVTHRLVTPGTHTVRLRAIDETGLAGEAEAAVIIADQAPMAAFDFNCNGSDCVFDPARSSDDKGITSYTWFVNGAQVAQTATPELFRSHWAAGVYTVRLSVSDGVFPAASFSRVVNLTAVGSSAYRFFALTPCRLYDSRTGAGTPLGSGQRISIAAAGRCGIPSTAKAVQVSPVIVGPTGTGHLQMSTFDGSVLPQTSVLTFDPVRSPRSSNTIVPLHRTGSFDATAVMSASNGTAATTHLVVDVTGYFSSDAAPADSVRATGPLSYAPLTPCRTFDSRQGTILSASVPQYLPVRSRCGVPADAKAAALNLGMVMPTSAGHAAMWPSSLSPMPDPYSTINLLANTNLMNGVLMKLGRRTSDDVALLFGGTGAASTAHAVVDVMGYFSDTAPYRYHTLSYPCRAVDTRELQRGDTRMVNGRVYSYQLQGNCGVPRGAVAAAVTLTLVGPDASGHLVAGASGLPLPATAALTFTAGDPAISNGLIVPLSAANLDLSVLAALVAPGGADLLVDVVGYFAAPAAAATETGKDESR